ncbi:MAG: XRE family transcriptional regulator [Rudaea sp.]|nr:XRE family transcriptional regulator [Rudaea sp.]
MDRRAGMTLVLDQHDPIQLGERLRTARSDAGMTQEEAAAALNLARTTLLAIEKGQRRVRNDELESFVRVYGVSVNALFRRSVVHVDLVPRFRAMPGTASDGSLAAAKLLNDLAAAEVELEKLTGRRLRKDYPAERPLSSGDLRDQAEDMAGEMRHRLGLGLAPIVDIVSLLEMELGVRVFIRPLAGKISGLFVFDEQIGACMLLNQLHPRERRAITAGHEFGHLLTARHEPDVVELGQRGRSRLEKFATLFALAFMMPAVVVRARFREYKQETGRFSARHLILMAHALHVSHEAMCRRLEDLKLLPEGTWEKLRSEGFSGKLRDEVLGDRRRDDELAVPSRLWMLASEAHRQDLMTEGQLAELLRMERTEIRRLLDTLESGDDHDLEAITLE